MKNVSLTIKPGEHIGLVGLNGSGKSTLIKMILGILKPSTGNVLTFGREPISNRQKNAMKIGIVFGQRSQLRWDLPALDTFKLNKEIYGVSDNDFSKRLAHLSRLLNADEFLQQPVRTLSLGQRMKAEFIAALIHDPELIILDEPTIGLDVVTKKSICAFLKTLTNKTIIFTSHDLTEVEEVSSRIIILHHGQLLLDKSIGEILRLDVPTAITFASSASLEELQNAFTNIRQLENGDYQIADLAKRDVKDTLELITSNFEVDRIEVKSAKLEYLLACAAKETGDCDAG